MQGFCLILAFFLAPIIPRMGFYSLKHKAFSIIQDTLNRRGYVRGYNEQPVMYFNVYEKVTDKCRHADMYKYMCYIFNSGTFVEYLKDKHRNHWSLEDYNKIQSIQYKHGFRQTTLN